MKKKKKAIYKGPVLSLTHKNKNINCNFIGSPFKTLAAKLEIDENTLLHIANSKNGNKTYEIEDLITDQIWLELGEFVTNKLSLNERKDKILEARTIKVLTIGKKLKTKKINQQKNRKFKASPYFIKGNLRKVISNGMTN